MNTSFDDIDLHDKDQSQLTSIIEQVLLELKDVKDMYQMTKLATMDGPAELREFKLQTLKKSDEFKQRMKDLKLKNQELQKESDLAKEKISESSGREKMLHETIKALKLEFEGFSAGKEAIIEELQNENQRLKSDLDARFLRDNKRA